MSTADNGVAAARPGPARLLRRGSKQSISAGLAALAADVATWPGFAMAQTAEPVASASEPVIVSSFAQVDPQNAAGLAVFMGLVVFSTLTALLHLRERRRWEERERLLAAELTDLRARNDRADLMLAAEPQVVIAWGGRGGEPVIEGDTGIIADGASPRRVLAFGSWLSPIDAQGFEEALDRLKTRGEGFRATVRTLGGRYLESEGRTVGGRAVLRLREITGDRRDLAQTRETLGARESELGALRTMLDTIPQPVWVRDASGKVSWANAAYARAVEASDGADAADRGLELLDRPAREDAARLRSLRRPYAARVPAVVAGTRKSLDVVEVPGKAGSAGIATDVSELESLRADLERQAAAHARTLDQLPTAVAIFDASQRLVFYNSAYRQLWNLDEGFLDSRPLDGEILDRLRSGRKLQEQADFKSWKAAFLSSYRAVEPQEHWWYLPDGRTLRVVNNPNPQGGVTYLFDDVSERFLLESRYNALIRVQGETLGTLKEGVAVFGQDGRLKLFNPALASLWKLSPDMLSGKPHVDELVRQCRLLVPDEDLWSEIRGTVAGVHDARRGWMSRIGRRDGSVLDCAMAPLPDGATLLTFTDVTASVNVERALTEKNEALVKAARVRDDFVHHVSFELRSPLTHIIGFAQLLGDETVGGLNAKQREYAAHIMRSSTALDAIINDILDLATIDNGEMALSLERVDIRETIAAAVRGIEDRLAESAITLNLDAAPDIGAFVADAKRIRQVLFNLLSNAVGFSSSGQTVTLTARKTDREVTFEVRDQGRGIPRDVQDRIFERFESHTRGSRHRGVGLGLSIVRSFVELHGGTITLDSMPGQGTTVTCVFPAEGQAAREAAE